MVCSVATTWHHSSTKLCIEEKITLNMDRNVALDSSGTVSTTIALLSRR